MAKTPPEARRERLAAALRANLKRRKTGVRMAASEKTGAPEPVSTTEERTGADHHAPPGTRAPR